MADVDTAGEFTGAQSLVKSLEQVGAETVFGIPGGAILPAYDPLYDSEHVRHILVRHEQGAGHAAQGYAMVTGKVGVCMATSGPGATNLVTPIADAYMDSVPMVAITGQVASAGHRHRRVPGSRHPRHHHADHQAQLPGDQGRRHPGRDRLGLPHRRYRTTRTGAGRHHQGRAAGQVRLHLADAAGPAGLPPGDQAARQAGARGGPTDRRSRSARCSTWAAACSRRRRPRSCASSPT